MIFHLLLKSGSLKEVMQNNILNTYNLVFFDYTKNTFITPNEINCYLQRLNNKYNICPHIHTHMLRHTYATRCIEAGMSAKVLQDILGHRKFKLLWIHIQVFLKNLIKTKTKNMKII